MLKAAMVVATLLLASCGSPEQSADNGAEANLTSASQPEGPAPVTAPANDVQAEVAANESTSRAIADAAEGDGSASEADAALAVTKAYFSAIEQKKFDAAWALRWKGEGDDATSRKAFIDHYAGFQEHHATVGVPSSVEGAAGSLYVEIPVQLYGRGADGKPFGSAGVVTLRRVNDVPGSSAEQRRWRIYSRD